MSIFENYYYNKSKVIILLFIIGAFTWAIFSDLVDGDWGSLENSLANLSRFFHESLWPPDWTVIEPQAYPVCTEIPVLDFRCSTAWIGMTETLKIAFVATIFGMLISLPISLLAARNLNPLWVSYPARILLAAFRTLPSIIWAILFVILIGFGPVSGTLAMTFYTIGYLGKLQYESIEGISRDPLDAADAMGLNKIEKSIGVVIPESANNLISQLIFMFEYNVRHGTVIGIVGAGGIGYYINLYLKFLQYDKVIAYLIIIFITVVIIDLISIYARSFFTEKENLKRASWKEVFIPEFLFSKFKK
mgnify:CR=1 FL=1|tara:strand:+ start:966 stop:1877 length:912 start_codon:yes stop_codon:yes gene_type:complete